MPAPQILLVNQKLTAPGPVPNWKPGTNDRLVSPNKRAIALIESTGCLSLRFGTFNENGVPLDNSGAPRAFYSELDTYAPVNWRSDAVGFPVNKSTGVADSTFRNCSFQLFPNKIAYQYSPTGGALVWNNFPCAELETGNIPQANLKMIMGDDCVLRLYNLNTVIWEAGSPIAVQNLPPIIPAQNQPPQTPTNPAQNQNALPNVPVSNNVFNSPLLPLLLIGAGVYFFTRK